MNIEFTHAFEAETQQICRKNPQLQLAFKKQLNLFKSNPFHPSLRLHKLKGVRSEQYAIWIKDDLRALSIKSATASDTYIFFDVVTHDEY
jgi:mRNA-degrading endonuclease YafQ of YafQ-DinJ toxin-antitoxin module